MERRGEYDRNYNRGYNNRYDRGDRDRDYDRHRRQKSSGSDNSSRYEKNHTGLKLDNQKTIVNFPKKGDNLDEFLTIAGFKLERGSVEGYSRAVHKQHFSKLVKENPQIKRVCEIGFNLGHSAVIFLDEIKDRENSLMVSFDILQHNYVYFGKIFMDINYPNKHILIGGDSSVTVPTFNEFYHSTFDLIFIDGDHSEKGAYNDIVNMRNYAHKDTILIIDNVAPHCGFGKGVFNAWKKAIDEKLLIHDRHIEIDDYRDAFAYCRYYFPDDKIENNNNIINNNNEKELEKVGEKRKFEDETNDDNDNNKVQKLEITDEVGTSKSNQSDENDSSNVTPMPDFQKITRRVEITELSKELKSLRYDEKYRFNEIKKRIQELDDEGTDKVDQWARDELAQKQKQFEKN